MNGSINLLPAAFGGILVVGFYRAGDCLSGSALRRFRKYRI